MRSKKQRGVEIMEFSLSMLVLVPLLLGTTVTGLNMLLNLQTVQVARDAGHMYAKGTDFSQPGNQTILVAVGADLGLTTSATTSKALVILSTVTYVDKALCQSAGAVDSNGNPSGCTNYQQWVFTQRIEIGNTALRTSNFGSPLTSGPNPVTVNATTGDVSVTDQATNAGDVATFSGINPYADTDGTVTGLPSGQVIYISEAAANGFTMPPYSPDKIIYAYGLF
jgi:hypothetical protein